jgi:GntR family transcriptional regulator
VRQDDSCPLQELMMDNKRRPIAQPLHSQLRALMLERISAGEWSPGTYLPSENRLAEEYAVSVGTLRKALLDLAQEGIVVRRQGKGTVVATHEGDENLFRFLNLRRNDGTSVLPDSRVLSRSLRPATAEESKALCLASGAEVVDILRVRDVDGTPAIYEEITLCADRFAGIDREPEVLPNTLYNLYQRVFGVTVHHARESITAVALEPRAAQELHRPQGTACLRIVRIAEDYQGTPLEMRVSVVATDALTYRCLL